MRRRTSRACRRTSYPATSTRPSSTRNSVVMARTAVVLPAPFGPSRPWTVPRATVRSSPSSAHLSLYLFRAPSTMIASVIRLLPPSTHTNQI